MGDTSKRNIDINGDNDDTVDNSGDTTGNRNSSGDSNGDNISTEEIDVKAFADLISEKDKELSEQREEITKLKKSNAELLVRINAGTREEAKDLGQIILDFCDTRKIK